MLCFTFYSPVGFYERPRWYFSVLLQLHQIHLSGEKLNSQKPIPILINYHADTFNPIQSRPRRCLVKTCLLLGNANLNVFSRKETKRIKHPSKSLLCNKVPISLRGIAPSRWEKSTPKPRKQPSSRSWRREKSRRTVWRLGRKEWVGGKTTWNRSFGDKIPIWKLMKIRTPF
jgi:hypothetical protein